MGADATITLNFAAERYEVVRGDVVLCCGDERDVATWAAARRMDLAWPDGSRYFNYRNADGSLNLS
jgi:hypothetical protein